MFVLKLANYFMLIKFYLVQGLGTNNHDETIKYFKNMKKHTRNFHWADEKDSKSIELAFSKSEVTSRKTWLAHGFEVLYISMSYLILIHIRLTVSSS